MDFESAEEFIRILAEVFGISPVWVALLVGGVVFSVAAGVIGRIVFRLGVWSKQAAAADQPQQSAPDPDEDLSPELRELTGKANELLIQANRLMANANEQDAEEMQELMDQLRGAIQARTPGDIRDASAKLDDLVFYLQEAT